MFDKGFFSKIFSEADITAPKNGTLETVKDVTDNDINVPVQKESSKNIVKEKEVRAEISQKDIKKLDSKKSLSSLPVELVEPSLKSVKKASDIKNVYLDISKNNANISKSVKKTIKNLNVGENQRIKTASDILEQSQNTNVYLKKISDDLIDEQDTKVKKSSDALKPVAPLVKEVTKETPDNTTQLLGQLIGMAAGSLTSIVAKNLKTFIWKYAKSAVSTIAESAWNFTKSAATNIKPSAFGLGLLLTPTDISDGPDPSDKKNKSYYDNLKKQKDPNAAAKQAYKDKLKKEQKEKEKTNKTSREERRKSQKERTSQRQAKRKLDSAKPNPVKKASEGAKTQDVKVIRPSSTSSVDNKEEQTKKSSGSAPTIFDLLKSGADTAKGVIDDIKAGAGDAVQWSKNLLLSKNDVKLAIKNAAIKSGVPEDFLAKIANIESGFDPSAKAKTSTAGGLFQFLDGTWATMLKSHGKEYGLTGTENKYDPKAAALMGAAYIKDNMNALKGVKPKLTATDLYMAHFLGAGGARTFLKAMAINPKGNAAAIMGKQAAANKNIFFGKDGSPRSFQSIYNLMSNKLGDNGTSQDLMSDVKTASPTTFVNKAINTFTSGAGGYGGNNTPQAPTFGGGGDTSGYMQTKTVEGVSAKFTAPVGGKIGAALSIGSDVDMSGIQSTFLGNLSAMAADFKQRTGQSLQINSGFRSFAKQQQLYNEGVAKYGADKVSKWVAKPGGSMHNFGLAVDISSKQGNILNDSGLLHAYGFVRPMPNEPWHIEPDSINRSAVAANPSGEAAKVRPVTVAKGPIQNNIKATTPPPVGQDKQKAKSESAMLPEGPKKASQNTIKYPETTTAQNVLKPVTEKSNKEKKVATDSKSLAEGTKTRETTVTNTDKNSSTSVSINSSDNKKEHSENTQNLFRNKIHSGKK